MGSVSLAEAAVVEIEGMVNMISPLDKCMILRLVCLALLDEILFRPEGLGDLYIATTSLS